MNTKKGRVTVPTDVDVIDETLQIIERWGLMQYGTVMVPICLNSFKSWM